MRQTWRSSRSLFVQFKRKGLSGVHPNSYPLVLVSGNCRLLSSSVSICSGVCIGQCANDWIIEDELVSTDELQEQIQEFEDYVQSTDIAAMQSE